MRQEEIRDVEAAEGYDTPGTGMFAPEVLGPTVERLAELAGTGRVLEFAVGTGRVAIPLAGRGVPVTGIGLSGPMTEVAAIQTTMTAAAQKLEAVRAARSATVHRGTQGCGVANTIRYGQPSGWCAAPAGQTPLPSASPKRTRHFPQKRHPAWR